MRNKLSARQYDLTTWGARSWLAFQTQQLSVKLHIACAWEIATELGIAAARQAYSHGAGLLASAEPPQRLSPGAEQPPPVARGRNTTTSSSWC